METNWLNTRIQDDKYIINNGEIRFRGWQCIRWEHGRALNIYLKVTDVQSESKKRALFRGSDLQDIFYNLPRVNATCSKGVIFEIAIKKLDKYLLLQQSRVLQRDILHPLKQDYEKFEKFLVRLRNQAEKWKFYKSDEHLIDQITEKYTSVELPTSFQWKLTSL